MNTPYLFCVQETRREALTGWLLLLINKKREFLELDERGIQSNSKSDKAEIRVQQDSHALIEPYTSVKFGSSTKTEIAS